jgi:hypothetical protein
MARFSPSTTAPSKRFGPDELHVDQWPQPMTDDLRLPPALAMGEGSRGALGNFARFVLIPLIQSFQK